MPFWIDDLATMFSDFGVDASWSGKTFKVVFDNEYSAARALGVEVESCAPSMLARDSDITGMSQGQAVTIEGTAYKVAGVQPDGTGVSAVVLSRD